MQLKQLIDRVLDLVYPPRCCFCRKITDKQDSGICPDCRSRLPRIPVTQQALLYSAETGGVCCAPLYYEGMVRESFLRYKFSGLVSYAPVYASLMAECLRSQNWTVDVITWVPLSRSRLRKRGYDQAELLARELGCLLGLDVMPILYKNRNNKVQSRTGSAHDRSENVKGVYSVRKDADPTGKRVLIVDDIITTGATLSECRKVLLRAGAAGVWAATFARASK